MATVPTVPCPHCGRQNSPTAVICPRCEARLEVQPPAQVVEEVLDKPRPFETIESPQAQSNSSKFDPPTNWRRWFVRIVSVIAFMLAISLVFKAMEIGGVAGCDGSRLFDCDEVWATKWSTWLQVPVGVPAALLYMTISVCTFLGGSDPQSTLCRTAWVFVAWLAALAFCAALWFIGIQAFVIQKFCMLCLSTHLCGIAIAAVVATGLPFSARTTGRILLMVIPAFGIFTIGQFAQKVEKYRLSSVPPSELVKTRNDPTRGPLYVGKITKPNQDARSMPETELGEGPTVSVLSGGAIIAINEHPLIGQTDADLMIVKLFDYTCPFCRKLHRHLTAAKHRYGDQIAICMLPVPQEAICNHTLEPYATRGSHQHACRLARYAIWVWQNKPAEYPQFSAWLSQETLPALKAIREQAEEIVGSKATDDVIFSDEMDARIRLYIELSAYCPDTGIPKLLFGSQIFDGITEEPEELFELLEREFDVRPLKPDASS